MSMSNNVTHAPRVPVLRSTDAERPVELRFGPHTDADGGLTEAWTVERLTLEQSAALLADLAALLGIPPGSSGDLRVVS